MLNFGASKREGGRPLDPGLASCIKSCLRVIIDLHVVEARFGNFASC